MYSFVATVAITWLLWPTSASAAAIPSSWRPPYYPGQSPPAPYYPNPNPNNPNPLPQCDEATVALAAGIHINIIGQYAEYNGTLTVQQVETTMPGNTEMFDLAKGELMSDIQGGMNIRLFNQEIAPADNAVIPGLAQYAAAQETEKALVAGLTGDYSVDQAAIESLLSDIQKGIQLNTANLAAAVSQCEFYLQFPSADQMGT